MVISFFLFLHKLPRPTKKNMKKNTKFQLNFCTLCNFSFAFFLQWENVGSFFAQRNGGKNLLDLEIFINWGRGKFIESSIGGKSPERHQLEWRNELDPNFLLQAFVCKFAFKNISFLLQMFIYLYSDSIFFLPKSLKTFHVSLNITSFFFWERGKTFLSLPKSAITFESTH